MSQAINDKGQNLVDAAGRLRAGDQNLASTQRARIADTSPTQLQAQQTTAVNAPASGKGILGTIDNVAGVANQIGDAISNIPGIGGTIGSVIKGVTNIWDTGKNLFNGIKNLFSGGGNNNQQQQPVQ